MKVQVQFFSHLKDLARTSECVVEVPAGAKVDDLLAILYARASALRPWDATILVGAGLEFVARDYVLRPNEEIAIMPPVQGG